MPGTPTENYSWERLDDANLSPMCGFAPLFFGHRGQNDGHVTALLTIARRPRRLPWTRQESFATCSPRRDFAGPYRAPPAAAGRFFAVIRSPPRAWFRGPSDRYSP